MSERLTVMLEDGVSEMLQALAGSSRKQGEYLSRVIKSLYAGQAEIHEGGELEMLRLTLAQVSAKLAAHDGRLQIIEQQLERLQR